MASIVQVATRSTCSICKGGSTRRAQADALFLRRHLGELTWDQVCALLPTLGYDPAPAKPSLRRHLASHSRIVEDEAVAEEVAEVEAGMDEAHAALLDSLARGEASDDDVLRWVIEHFGRDVARRVKAGERVPISVEQMTAAVKARTAQAAERGRMEILAALGGGIAQALGRGLSVAPSQPELEAGDFIDAEPIEDGEVA